MRVGVIVQFARKVPDGLVAEDLWKAIIRVKSEDTIFDDAVRAYRQLYPHYAYKEGTIFVTQVYDHRDRLTNRQIMEKLQEKLDAGRTRAMELFGVEAEQDRFVIFDQPD